MMCGGFASGDARDDSGLLVRRGFIATDSASARLSRPPSGHRW